MDKINMDNENDDSNGVEMDPKFLLYIQKYSYLLAAPNTNGEDITDASGWDDTIFAWFKNQKLKLELQNWANENSCNISWGMSPPDIIAVPFFVSIIDRNLLGLEGWESYLEFIRRVNDNKPMVSESELIDIKDDSVCIIVDDIRDMELPKLDTVLYFDLNEKESIPTIIKTVAAERMYLHKKGNLNF